jgi:hypothetical protein
MSEVFLEALQDYLRGREWKVSCYSVFVTLCCYSVLLLCVWNGVHVVSFCLCSNPSRCLSKQTAVSSLGAPSSLMITMQFGRYPFPFESACYVLGMLITLNFSCKAFQEVVELVLDTALSCVGGSLEILERSLEDIASRPAYGPRDDMIKEVLGRLLTYERCFDLHVCPTCHYETLYVSCSFEEFSMMMKEAARSHKPEIRRENPISYRYIDTLITMGFPSENVHAVVEEYSDYVTLEELVMKLSAMDSIPATPCKSSPARKSDEPAVLVKKTNAAHAYLELLTEYLRGAIPRLSGVFSDSVFDLHTKFVSADSVFESLSGGNGYDFSEQSDLLDWAKGMLEFQKTAQNAHRENQDLSSCRVRDEDLASMFMYLEKLRHAIDENEAVGNLLSDKELERMAELNSIAMLGSEDEQLLHRLISRNDEVLVEISKMHRSITNISRPGSDVDREKLEELYLYLKEQVASGVDLSALADEMHEQVYSVLTPEKCALVVNVLLDLHILEEEQMWLRQRIKEMTNSSSSSPQRDAGDKSAAKSYPLENDMPNLSFIDSYDLAEAKFTDKSAVIAASGLSRETSSYGNGRHSTDGFASETKGDAKQVMSKQVGRDHIDDEGATTGKVFVADAKRPANTVVGWVAQRNEDVDHAKPQSKGGNVHQMTCEGDGHPVAADGSRPGKGRADAEEKDLGQDQYLDALKLKHKQALEVNMLQIKILFAGRSCILGR